MPPKDRTKRRVVPRQERAKLSEEAILAAAEILLRDEGFERMTTNRIAARAGVNVALVYRYFSGKEAIVGALIERISWQTRGHFAEAIALHVDAPLAVALRAFVQALVELPAVPELHRELFEHVDVTKRRDVVRRQVADMSELFEGFLQRRKSELRPLVDPRATLFVLEHTVEAATNAAAFYRPEDLELGRVLDALTELLVRTLLPVQDAG